MTERELIAECKNRGFIQRKKSYMRVIGDGVFQHILFGFKERLDPSAPGYSKTHRFEPKILIYLKSLYAQYEGVFVSIDSTIGHRFDPTEFIDKPGLIVYDAEPNWDRVTVLATATAAATIALLCPETAPVLIPLFA